MPTTVWVNFVAGTTILGIRCGGGVDAHRGQSHTTRIPRHLRTESLEERAPTSVADYGMQRPCLDETMGHRGVWESVTIAFCEFSASINVNPTTGK